MINSSCFYNLLIVQPRSLYSVLTYLLYIWQTHNILNTYRVVVVPELQRKLDLLSVTEVLFTCVYMLSSSRAAASAAGAVAAPAHYTSGRNTPMLYSYTLLKNALNIYVSKPQNICRSADITGASLNLRPTRHDVTLLGPVEAGGHDGGHIEPKGPLQLKECFQNVERSSISNTTAISEPDGYIHL